MVFVFGRRQSYELFYYLHVPIGLAFLGAALIHAWSFWYSPPRTGIFPRYRHPQKPNWAFNRRSKSYRPPGVVFCSETQALVQDIDHFCPWTGTTIARKNILYFYCFLGALCILLAYMVIVGMLSSLPPGAFEPTMRKKGRP